MTENLPVVSLWPPFKELQVPSELHGLIEDFQRAVISDHSLSTTRPLLTVVVPCFNPDPIHFHQLLLSLRQQSDQDFHLLLVNDGSSEASWSAIQSQLDAHPWIQVLHQPGNTGISAALNAALDQVLTPYVAMVDQDDILHPGALALVRRYLETHPDCGLLYSDHLVFDDERSVCRYIPKFPWNPHALLEFNFLIHLTVVRTELYRACGGMNSRFDGIQDWEFYLRLVPYLDRERVGYLPVPLYAWRLSALSVASSARPKAELLDLSYQFLSEAHQCWGTGTLPLLLDASHYRFMVDPAPLLASGVIHPCHVLVLAPSGADAAAVEATLQSVADVGLPIARVFISQESDHDDNAEAVSLAVAKSKLWNCSKPELLSSHLNELPDQLPRDAPLLVLQAGVQLSDSPGWRHVSSWLECSDFWDLITFPGFEPLSGVCVSAGYSSVTTQQSVYCPHGQGLNRDDYLADFASFGHTRLVDLPSPTVQLLGRDCLAATLEKLRSFDIEDRCTVSTGWWRHLASLPWRCGCPADLTVTLSPCLTAAERYQLASRQPAGVVLVSVSTWLATNNNDWMLAYGALLNRVIAQGVGRIHPLFALSWMSGAQHPASLKAAQNGIPRFSLLPRATRRPLVILIPTELNARSHGHACMLTLALQLQATGQLVYLLPFKPYTFFRNYLNQLPDAYRQLTFIADPSEAKGGILLVPESAPNGLVKRLRRHYDALLWWLLAPAGLLTKFRPDIRIGDRLVAFSEFALPQQSGYLFVHPPVDPALIKEAARHSPQPPQCLQIALYTGKGRLKPLPRSLHRHLLKYKVVVINRSFPATRNDLVRLLSDSNGLISFDPMTNLSLEAATLGVPTFLPANPFPARCFRNFPINLSAFITDSPAEFISYLQAGGPLRKMPTEQLIRQSSQALVLADLLTADPSPLGAQPFFVTAQTIQDIEQYRRMLSRSQTIQVVRDGQSSSSVYSGLYTLSLKAPYAVHWWICYFFSCLDRTADFLMALGCFRAFRPLINQAESYLQSFSRTFRRFGRLVIR